MGKSASSLPNMVLTLVAITLISGSSLGFVYQLTKEPIAASRLMKQQEAIRAVVPGFNNNPADEMYKLTSSEGFEIKVFPAKKDGEPIGVAIETVSNKGYSGNIKIMVGLGVDGTIINYKVLEHKETPGLGTKMDDWFKTDKGNQNILGKHPGKNNLVVTKDGGEVDAITAATITSRAFLHAVEVAYTTYMLNKDVASQETTTTNQEKGGNQ